MSTQPSKEQQQQVLREVADWTSSPTFGATHKKFDANPENTGIADSFNLVALDPGVVQDAADGKVDIGTGIRNLHRWHHQMRVGNLPAYAESLLGKQSEVLGTLVTNSTLATTIDREWSKASAGLPADSDVMLLRSPDYSLVAFVRTVNNLTQCWIVAPSNSKVGAYGKWLDSAQMGKFLSRLRKRTGFTTAKPLPRQSQKITKPERSSAVEGLQLRTRQKRHFEQES